MSLYRLNDGSFEKAVRTFVLQELSFNAYEQQSVDEATTQLQQQYDTAASTQQQYVQQYVQPNFDGQTAQGYDQQYVQQYVQPSFDEQYVQQAQQNEYNPAVQQYGEVAQLQEQYVKSIQLEQQYSQAVQHQQQISQQVANDIIQLREEAINEKRRAEEEADILLRRAKNDADYILQEAEKNALKLYEENAQRGMDAGYADGLASANLQAEATLAKKLEELEALSQALIEEQNRFIGDQSKLIVELATSIAEKIIGRQLEIDDNTLFDMLEQVVSQLVPCNRLIITVSEIDYELLLHNVGRVKEIAKGFENIEINSVENQKRGFLKLETRIVAVDASADTQIGIIKSELEKAAL